MEKTATDPDTYIASLPAKRRADLLSLDAHISQLMPGHSRVMWEGRFWGGSDQRIVGYGDYSYQRSGKQTVEWFIVGLAPQKNYISIYVNAADEDGHLVKKYADRLGKVKIGSAAISFKTVDDIDLDVLGELVTQARDRMS